MYMFNNFPPNLYQLGTTSFLLVYNPDSNVNPLGLIFSSLWINKIAWFLSLWHILIRGVWHWTTGLGLTFHATFQIVAWHWQSQRLQVSSWQSKTLASSIVWKSDVCRKCWRSLECHKTLKIHNLLATCRTSSQTFYLLTHVNHKKHYKKEKPNTW